MEIKKNVGQPLFLPNQLIDGEQCAVMAKDVLI